jgi:pyridoxal phosphate enzyme (YggS family)
MPGQVFQLALANVRAVMSAIADNIARVRERIARAAERAGRDPAAITLVAVSKTVPPERVREAVAAGIRDLGENYYQEARDKLPLFGPEVRWHFIGHLQTNKAKYIAGRFALVHSIDSDELARELGKRALAAGGEQPVLVEVKLDPEAAKFGVEPDAAPDLVSRVAEIPGLRLQGLMGMAPFVDDPDRTRPYFAQLRGLFELLPIEHRQILSMGMTSDFEIAIEEGATMVRIGTAIFGQRR